MSNHSQMIQTTDNAVELTVLRAENEVLRQMPHMEYCQRILEAAKLVGDGIPDFLAFKEDKWTDAMPVPDAFVEPFNELIRVVRKFEREPNRENVSEVTFRATEVLSAMKALFYWTPSASWRVLKEKDPHGTYYARQRQELPMGGFTDDALANHNFMSPSVASLTAIKERVRFLSRYTHDLQKENTELKARLAALEGNENAL